MQAAPGREGGGRPRLRTAERGQVELRAVNLDDLVPADHRGRLVWRVIEGLDLSALMARIKAVEGRPGHLPADPRILMGLWLFAKIEGGGSARALARRCAEDIAFQWLCGGVSMNHKTLSDFRVGHGAILERLLADSFAALMAAGVAGLERVAQDGVRVRASAGAASFRRHSTLKECRRRAREEVARLRRELDADPGAAWRCEAAARQRAAEDRERRVETALAVTADLRAAQAEKARKRADDPPEVAARRRMASEEAKDIYKQRAATVECVKPQARNRGLTRFTRRSATKENRLVQGFLDSAVHVAPQPTSTRKSLA